MRCALPALAARDVSCPRPTTVARALDQPCARAAGRGRDRLRPCRRGPALTRSDTVRSASRPAHLDRRRSVAPARIQIPENIMLRPDGYVKVLDFGIAKLAESAFAEATAHGAGSMTPADTNLGSIL